jgi:hypothetical protein
MFLRLIVPVHLSRDVAMSIPKIARQASELDGLKPSSFPEDVVWHSVALFAVVRDSKMSAAHSLPQRKMSRRPPSSSGLAQTS